MADLPVHHRAKQEVVTTPSEPPTTNSWADITSNIYRPCEPRMVGRNLEIQHGCAAHPVASFNFASLFGQPQENPQPHPHPHHPKGPSPTEGDNSQPGKHSHAKGHPGHPGTPGDTSPSQGAPTTGMTDKGAPTEGTVSAAAPSAKASNKGESASQGVSGEGVGKGKGKGGGVGEGGGMGHGHGGK